MSRGLLTHVMLNGLLLLAIPSGDDFYSLPSRVSYRFKSNTDRVEAGWHSQTGGVAALESTVHKMRVVTTRGNNRKRMSDGSKTGQHIPFSGWRRSFSFSALARLL